MRSSCSLLSAPAAATPAIGRCSTRRGRSHSPPMISSLSCRSQQRARRSHGSRAVPMRSGLRPRMRTTRHAGSANQRSRAASVAGVAGPDCPSNRPTGCLSATGSSSTVSRSAPPTSSARRARCTTPRSPSSRPTAVLRSARRWISSTRSVQSPRQRSSAGDCASWVSAKFPAVRTRAPATIQPDHASRVGGSAAARRRSTQCGDRPAPRHLGEDCRPPRLGDPAETGREQPRAGGRRRQSARRHCQDRLVQINKSSGFAELRSISGLCLVVGETGVNRAADAPQVRG